MAKTLCINQLPSDQNMMKPQMRFLWIPFIIFWSGCRVWNSKIFLSQSSSIEHATGHSSLDSSIIFVAYFVRPVPLRSSVGNLKLRNNLGRGFSGSVSPSVASVLPSGFCHAIISTRTRSERCELRLFKIQYHFIPYLAYKLPLQIRHQFLAFPFMSFETCFGGLFRF